MSENNLCTAAQLARAAGYPLKIIGNGGYPATLVGLQPLNNGDFMAIYRYKGGDCCHDIADMQYFTIVEK